MKLILDHEMTHYYLWDGGFKNFAWISMSGREVLLPLRRKMDIPACYFSFQTTNKYSDKIIEYVKEAPSNPNLTELLRRTSDLLTS